jgi:hypothetical protein
MVKEYLQGHEPKIIVVNDSGKIYEYKLLLHILIM